MHENIATISPPNDPVRRTVLTTIAVGVFCLYVATNHAFAGRPAATLDVPLDHAIPFWPPAMYVYFSVYLFLFLPVAQVRHMKVFERVALALSSRPDDDHRAFT